MCRRAKHLHQLYAHSRNTLNDHTGHVPEMPHLDPPDDGPTLDSSVTVYS